ncbi:MAG: hypothetical protein WCA77_05060, partial [Thermoplasmata archaeon]
MTVVVLLVALFSAWYVWSISEPSGANAFTVTEQFDPGSRYSVTTSCAGPDCPPSDNASHSQPYTTGALNHTGSLYEATQFLIVIGVLLAGSSLLGALFLPRESRIRTIARVVGILALVLAVSSPAITAGYQPTALHADTSSVTPSSTPVSGSGTGPAYTFVGSCSGTDCGIGSPSGLVAKWGPGAGWYLGFLAFFLLVAAELALVPARRPDPSPPSPSGNAEGNPAPPLDEDPP